MYYLIQMSYNLGVKQTYKIVLIEIFVKRYTVGGDSIYKKPLLKRTIYLIKDTLAILTNKHILY